MAISITDSPFAVLTFIAAPAILTNASSVLAMSTINRWLRTRDRMQLLFTQSQQLKEPCDEHFLSQVNRVERQAVLLLTALRSVYVSLGSFAAAALVTLLGAAVTPLVTWMPAHLAAGAGLVLGFVGVAGLIRGCVNLFHATQLSMDGIREEAALIRQRQRGPQGC